MSRDFRPDAFALAAEDLPLSTDLYELTMAVAYERWLPRRRGVFELFVRRWPERRNFLVLAGLESAIAALLEWRFTEDHIAWLRSLPAFAGVDATFFEGLARFRFRADVEALPEGSIFFPGEPLLRVRGGLVEAQLVETLLLTCLGFPSAVASKAARMRLAAGDEAQLVEFGGRRAHGPEAALWAARAAWIGGFDATSNLQAARRVDIPAAGTMAHSFVLAFDGEQEAFARYQQTFPQATTLLLDTYDSLEALDGALAAGLDFAAVRLDSGNLGELARAVRGRLDAAGRRRVGILVSGDLDEWRIRDLRVSGAPIDAFGVGTRLATVEDGPSLGAVYKLIAIEEDGQVQPRGKRSAEKADPPGVKQVLRRRDAAGVLVGDRIVPADSTPLRPGESPLLVPVLRAGEVVRESPALPLGAAAARQRCKEELARLPAALRQLDATPERTAMVASEIP